MFDPKIWAAVPFHFWTVVFFTFGCIVGSFLNVCIHRMPRDESVVSPPSHCPHCKYSIPWFLNLPLATWLYLRGKCANCGAPISVRYFLVELLTGLSFVAAWLSYGRSSPGVAVVYCVLLAGFIVASFIDLEHFIIPDEITLGGVAVGVFLSALVPSLHGLGIGAAESMKHSFIGAAVGGGLVYAIVLLGKLMFGRQPVDLPPDTRITFGETSLRYADKEVPYEEIFYRRFDTVSVSAKSVEMADRCYRNVEVRLSQGALRVGDEKFSPEEVPFLEVIADRIVLPREAMGLGDVKFMAAIGAFLGAGAVIFSLMLSAMIGSVVGLTLIVIGRRSWSNRIPYGPYIALAAIIWVFGAHDLVRKWWLGGTEWPATGQVTNPLPANRVAPGSPAAAELKQANPPRTLSPAPGKIKFRLDNIRADGLRGPADGLVSVAYEFCVPAEPAAYEAVRRMDPSVKISPGSRGRIGCSARQALCIGNTHQRNWREVLANLAALPYVAEVRECFFE